MTPYDLAKFGIDRAVSFLGNPSLAPGGTLSAGVYVGETALQPSGASADNVDIVVTSLGGAYYQVSSIGHHVPSTGNVVSRRIIANVQTFNEYLIPHGLMARNNVTLPSFLTVNGSARSDGTITNNGTITGTIYDVAHSNVPATPAAACPQFSELKLIQEYTAGVLGPHGRIAYTWDNRYWEMQNFTSATILGGLNGDAFNGANVWYTTSDVTIQSAFVRGTIVVLGGHTLKVTGSSTATAAPGMPSLLVSGNIAFSSSGTKSLQSTGLVYVGGGFTSTSGTTSNVTFGCPALMLGGTPAWNNFGSGVTHSVTYDSTKLQVPTLSTVGAQLNRAIVLNYAGDAAFSKRYRPEALRYRRSLSRLG